MYISRVCDGFKCDSDKFTLKIKDGIITVICDKCKKVSMNISLREKYSSKSICIKCNNNTFILKQDNETQECVLYCNNCLESLKTFRVNKDGNPMTTEEQIDEIFEKLDYIEDRISDLERELKRIEEVSYYLQYNINSIKESISDL